MRFTNIMQVAGQLALTGDWSLLAAINPDKIETGSEGEKTFAPEDISAMVLTKMKETTEAYLGKKVTHAVGCCHYAWR